MTLSTDIEDQIRKAVYNMHFKIQNDLVSISQRKRNKLEKRLLIELIEETIKQYHQKIPKKILNNYKNEVIKIVDEYWEKLEPSRTIRLK